MQVDGLLIAGICGFKLCMIVELARLANQIGAILTTWGVFNRTVLNVISTVFERLRPLRAS